MGTITLNKSKSDDSSIHKAARLTAEQRRAKHAWSCVGKVITDHAHEPKFFDGYKNDAKGLPALIMNSGLMQIMAFLHDKGDRHEVLAQHLRDWLAIQCGTPKDFDGFMTKLFHMDDARQFQAITTEAFAWLKWLRQMAAARAKE